MERSPSEGATLPQLVKKFSEFIETEGSLQLSQKPFTFPFPQPDQSIAHTNIIVACPF
jgi:hypothetical protein